MTSTLTWTSETRDGARIAAPAGRIDESTATAFGETLASEIEAAAAAGAPRLVIDLSPVEYMSSRGLRGLTLAQRKAGESGVTVVLAQPSEVMREILAISRYDKVFKVFADLPSAVAG